MPSPQLNYYHRTKTCASRSTIYLPRSHLFFKTKKALDKYLRETSILNYNILIHSSHPYYPFLRDMLDRHPHIEVQDDDIVFIITTPSNIFAKNRTPWRRSEPMRAYYKAGADDFNSFSLFKKCVRATPDTERYTQTREMRKAIDYQIKEFRRDNKSCVLCNSQEETDIDHLVPFTTLLANFQQSGELDWQAYHQKHAILQTLCRFCHQKKTQQKS